MAVAKAENTAVCYHCGENCESLVRHDDKVFCCEGCRTVYEILDENDLCTYYDLENSPGISLKSKADKKYEFLDNEKVREQLLDFSDDQISMVTFYLPQIHCSSCIWLLENLHKLKPQIKSSRVQFMKKEVSLTYYHDRVSLRQIAEMLSSLGYAPEINLQDLNKAKKKKVNKTLIYQLGIAGFCFGNIMLISLPEYFGLDNIREYGFSRFFAYVNILLALPVTFYSAADYFRSGITAMRNKTINIDVPIALGISVLFARSLYEIISHTGSGYLDSLSGLVFFLLLGKVFQQKTYNTLSFERDYKSYLPIAVTRLGKKEESIPISELKAGDRVLIRNDELIPVDSILISEKAHIDNSFVTGESKPVTKKSGDKIYAGGKQKGSAVELEVINELSQSYLTKVWDREGSSTKQKSFQNMTDAVSKYFTFIILLIAILTFSYWMIYNPSIAFNTFTAILIIACPCALALSAPFTLGNVLRIFGREKFYVKNTDAIETLSKSDHIVFDKTGTLTQNKSAQIEYKGSPMNQRERKALKTLVRQSSHPLSKMLYQDLPGDVFPDIIDFDEYKGEGIQGTIDGLKIKAGSAEFTGTVSPDEEKDIKSAVYINIDGKPRGCYSFNNRYREGLESTIGELGKTHELSMISGDNEGERPKMESIFGKGNTILFNQKPDQKSRYIDKLIINGKTVAMVGDGLNDAGALMKSHSGISISEDINTFSPACDAILDADQFKKLPDYISFSRLSVKIIWISFIISFIYNITGMFFAVQGLLSPVIAAILMPLSSITVVAFVTLSTNLAAKVKGLG